MCLRPFFNLAFNPTVMHVTWVVGTWIQCKVWVFGEMLTCFLWGQVLFRPICLLRALPKSLLEPKKGEVKYNFCRQWTQGTQKGFGLFTLGHGRPAGHLRWGWGYKRGHGLILTSVVQRLTYKQHLLQPPSPLPYLLINYITTTWSHIALPPWKPPMTKSTSNSLDMAIIQNMNSTINLLPLTTTIIIPHQTWRNYDFSASAVFP